MVTLLLGWTGVGWLGALIWSFTGVWTAPSATASPVAEASKPCAFCAETNKREATLCRYCGREQPVTAPALPAVDTQGC